MLMVCSAGRENQPCTLVIFIIRSLKYAFFTGVMHMYVIMIAGQDGRILVIRNHFR